MNVITAKRSIAAASHSIVKASSFDQEAFAQLLAALGTLMTLEFGAACRAQIFIEGDDGPALDLVKAAPALNPHHSNWRNVP